MTGTGRRVARRYARAAVELAQARGVLARVGSELSALADLFREDPAFRQLLENRRLPAARKGEELQRAVGEGLSEVTVACVKLLVGKGREKHLPAVAEEYRRLANELQGVADVEVQTARPLGEDERAALARRLGARLGREVRLAVREEPTLLGGVVVRVGDLVMDGSLATRLRRMEEHLRRAPVSLEKDAG